MSAKSVPQPAPVVGFTEVTERPMAQHLTVSSELVPFQEIDVYAKEAGYVKTLNVDYGSRVRKGDVMAVLEVPELEAQISRIRPPSRPETMMSPGRRVRSSGLKRSTM